MKNADPEAVRKYVEAAENQYRSIKDPHYLLIRPLVDFVRTPIYYYRTGILLSALEAGYHDVLEFGAGTCWFGAILYRLGSRVTFLEVSPTALRLGKKLFPRIRRGKGFCSPPRFIVYDGITFPLPDQSMDRIVCHDAFHHVPNPKRILQEMYRVLRPGGRVAFAEPGEGHSELDASREDMHEYGVLEADVSFSALQEMAKKVGFDDILFMPFPKIETMTLTGEEYLSFQGGEDNVIPHDRMREDLKYFQIIVLKKGPDVVDTRLPRDLRARIELIEKPSDLRSFIPGRWKVMFINIAETTWLSPFQETPKGKKKLNKAGGYVWVRVLLKDGTGALIDPNHCLKPILNNVPPRQGIEMHMRVPVPRKRGSYVFEFDLEIRGHYWFSDKHRNPTVSESLKVPFEL